MGLGTSYLPPKWPYDTLGSSKSKMHQAPQWLNLWSVALGEGIIFLVGLEMLIMYFCSLVVVKHEEVLLSIVHNLWPGFITVTHQPPCLSMSEHQPLPTITDHVQCLTMISHHLSMTKRRFINDFINQYFITIDWEFFTVISRNHEHASLRITIDPDGSYSAFSNDSHAIRMTWKTITGTPTMINVFEPWWFLITHQYYDWPVLANSYLAAVVINRHQACLIMISCLWTMLSAIITIIKCWGLLLINHGSILINPPQAWWTITQLNYQLKPSMTEDGLPRISVFNIHHDLAISTYCKHVHPHLACAWKEGWGKGWVRV